MSRAPEAGRIRLPVQAHPLEAASGLARAGGYAPVSPVTGGLDPRRAAKERTSAWLTRQPPGQSNSMG